MDMVHALVSGFLQCFNLSTFNLMMVGIAIGFVVGILPGLGGPTAMALMLPFVFKMSAVEAFAFLLGMTAVTATTGDITSVLFGVPGEPTTASTIVDGHAMARNGEAGRALGAVLMSSLVGAIFGVMEGVKDTFRHWWLVIRCSALGTFMAIIPGMGAATTQWLAYAHAVQSLEDKSRAGKGAVEGVLGPGAANNSTLGGSLITTIAFGVPASVIMAILLGAFIIQGIVPGPDMLIPEPRGHLGLTFSFVWVIIISNIITVGICFLFLEPLARITQVRGGIIIPIILVLVYLGAFAEKNAFEDMLVVLFFGGLGWIMEKLEWPRPPVLLGLVLGPLAENRLFLSTDRYGAAWLGRPGVLIIFAVTLFVVFYPTIKNTRQEKEKLVSQTHDHAAVEITHLDELRYSNKVLFIVVVAVLLALALWQSRNFGFRAGLFPWAIGIPTLLLALAQLGKDLLGREKPKAALAAWEVAVDVPPEVARQRTVSILIWTIGFFLAIWLLGFSYSIPVSMILYLKFAGKEKWPMTIAVTFFTWLFIYGLFERALSIPFPEGLLFTLLQ